jgi:hypothetical protein
MTGLAALSAALQALGTPDARRVAAAALAALPEAHPAEDAQLLLLLRAIPALAAGDLGILARGARAGLTRSEIERGMDHVS